MTANDRAHQDKEKRGGDQHEPAAFHILKTIRASRLTELELLGQNAAAFGKTSGTQSTGESQRVNPED